MVTYLKIIHIWPQNKTEFIINSYEIDRKVYSAYIRHLPGQCFTVHLKQCVNKTTYLDATLPNAFGHTTLSEVLKSSDNNPRLFDTECYGYAQDFWCSAYNPECKSGQPELPCKDYCFGNKNTELIEIHLTLRYF